MICDSCGMTRIVDSLPETWKDSVPPLATGLTIKDLQAEIAFIDMTRQRLAQRRLDACRMINTLTPIARLPPEVLTEIFRVATSRRSKHHSRAEKPMTPLIFGSVCREWREIAWSTPLLWNRLPISVSSRTGTTQVQLLRDWLMRATTSPLHIQLSSAVDNETVGRALPAVLEALLERSSYWYSLSALLPPECHDILEKRHFPMLRTVLVRPPNGSISTFSRPPNMFASAPNLRDVDLSGHNFSSMFLPWAQLRKFRTQFVTLNECLEVLRRSTYLKDCRLETIYLPDIVSSTPTTTVYSELEIFNISLIKGAATSLFDHIALPNLHTLVVEFMGIYVNHLTGVGTLAARSSCSLQALHIRTQEFHEDDLLECLRCIPTLEYLNLSMWQKDDPTMGLTKRVVEALKVDMPEHRTGGSILLPKLESLVYRGPVTADGELLIRMLGERWRASALLPYQLQALCAGGGSVLSVSTLSPLKAVEIRGDISLPDHVMLEMKQLILEGMNLIITPTGDR